MAHATIEFHEIFLFATRPDRLTVLAPAKGHFTYLSGPGLPQIPLTSHVVTLLRNGAPATGTLHADTEPYVVDLGVVLKRTGLRLRDMDPGALAAARFELGGDPCRLEGLPLSPAPGDEPYIEKAWSFGNGFSHRLSNRARVTFEADDARYQLKIEDAGGDRSSSAKLLPIKGGDVFVAQSTDIPLRASTIGPRSQIAEFVLLYELLKDRDGRTVAGPVPVDTEGPPPHTGSPAPVTIRCIRPVCPNAVCAMEP